MVSVAGGQTVLECISAIRGGAGEFITNLFLSEIAIRRLINDGRVLALYAVDCVLLLVEDDGQIRRLYFAAASHKALDKALEFYEMQLQDNWVVDIVGRQADAERVAAVFFGHGYCYYALFRRMARAGGSGFDTTEEASVQVAVLDQANTIHALISSAFDPLAEHLPQLEEVRDAVAANSILIVKQDRKIAGLLFFSNVGYSSNLRYWYINQEYRGKRFGAKLMRHYFALCPLVKRFTLWVNEANEAAVAKYRHYGYENDFVVDIIMTKGGLKWKA